MSNNRTTSDASALLMLPSRIYDAWLLPRGVSDVRPVGGGLSGAVVFRATGRSGLGWAVRGWPAGVDRGRVEEVHRAMRMARREGCGWTPAVESEPSWIAAEGRVWDCCQWMPGSPPLGDEGVGNLDLSDKRPGDERLGIEGLEDVLRQVATAVAQFHSAVGPLAQSEGPAAAVTARLERLAELPRRLAPVLAAGGESSGDAVRSPAVGRAIQTLRQVWGMGRRRAVDRLEPWVRTPLRQQYVFRDIHLGNTLFQHGQLSGIVDYDAVRVDSPATDLARVITSARWALRAEPSDPAAENLWSAVLVAYRAVRPFSAAEERLARVLAEISPLIILANWVVWVARERRFFPGPAARVEERIEGWRREVDAIFLSSPRQRISDQIETR